MKRKKAKDMIHRSRKPRYERLYNEQAYRVNYVLYLMKKGRITEETGEALVKRNDISTEDMEVIDMLFDKANYADLNDYVQNMNHFASKPD